MRRARAAVYHRGNARQTAAGRAVSATCSDFASMAMSTVSGDRHPVLADTRMRTSRHACPPSHNGVYCSRIGNAEVRRRRAVLTDARRRTASGRGVRAGACGCSPGTDAVAGRSRDGFLGPAAAGAGGTPPGKCHPRRLVVFRIKGNDYRLAARIDFANGIVRIVAVGTHAEYYRWRI